MIKLKDIILNNKSNFDNMTNSVVMEQYLNEIDISSILSVVVSISSIVTLGLTPYLIYLIWQSFDFDTNELRPSEIISRLKYYKDQLKDIINTPKIRTIATRLSHDKEIQTAIKDGAMFSSKFYDMIDAKLDGTEKELSKQIADKLSGASKRIKKFSFSA